LRNVSLPDEAQIKKVTFQKVSLGMLLCRLAKRTLFSTAVAMRLEFDGPRFTIEYSIGKVWNRQVVGEVQNIRSIDIMIEEVQVLLRPSCIQ